MYHYTRDLKHSRYPEIKGLDLPLFREQIHYFKDNFNVVTMEQVIDAAERKMNEFQAAMGLCNLRHIDKYIEDRRKVVKRYQELLEYIPGITVWHEQEDVEHNYAYFPIFIDEYIYGISRDQLFDILLSRGIVTRKYFYPITSDFDVYRKRFEPEATPIAMQKSKSVLTLPLYPELSDATIVEICDIIRNKS